MAKSKLMEMHNVGIVVASLDNAVAFLGNWVDELDELLPRLEKHGAQVVGGAV